MKCYLCREDKASEFLNLGQQPLANKYPATEEAFKTEDFFPLTVFFCENCKNVQLGTVVSRERMFEDYYYLSSVNLGLVRHFEQLAKKLVGSKFVLDVGSNDGILIKPLQELGVKAVGVDPSINVSKIANDAGLPTITAFFDHAAVEKVKEQYGKPDVIVASSIFTHLEDPHTFTEDIRSLMTDDGTFILEVEYIGNILKGIQFERFYLDRVFYYSLAALKHLFEGHDMRIVDVEEIEPHGGSMRVTICNKNSNQPVSASVDNFLKEEEKILNAEKLKEFRKSVEDSTAAFRAKLEEYKKLGLKVIGYGAPARLATISNFGKIGPALVAAVVDDSPLKQNRFSPGMHIPIVALDFLEKNNPDVLVVFAYEYFDDIKQKAGKYCKKYLIPIPPREIV